MSLLSLPTEVLTEILIQLDVPTSYSCQRVNRRLRSLYQTSVQLQYALECGIAGVDDNPFCRLPVSVRLEMLRRRESALSSLNPIFTKVQPLPMPLTSTESFDVACGHLFLGLEGFGSDTAHPRGGVKSYPLPLPEEDNQGTWVTRDFDGMITFASSIDEHDLLAAVIMKEVSTAQYDLSISLVSHSLGLPHPLARRPNFPVDRIEHAPDSVTPRIETVGENLVLCIETLSECTLYFFDWKIGQLKSPPIQALRYTDFVFLSHDVMLCCPSLEHNWFNIYYIPPSSKGGGVKLIQTLLLPTPFPFNYHRIEVRASPNPREDPAFPKYVSPKRAFVDRPEDAIILFTFHRPEGFVAFKPISLIIHRKALVNLLPPRSDWSRKDPLVLEWDQWGPYISRSFECPFNPRPFTTTCYGQRYIFDEPVIYQQPFVVLDFNLYRYGKETARRDNRDPPEPASYHKNGIIEGRLPYLSYRSPASYWFEGMHLSDTGVVCFHAS